MDWISRHRQESEGIRFGNHRISSLLFVVDVVLLASSTNAAECEAAGMKISTSICKAIDLNYFLLSFMVMSFESGPKV